MSKRIFLCDGSLRDFRGHCYEYLAPLRDALINHGAIVYVIGNKDQDIEFHEQTGVVPGFTYWCDHRKVGQPAGLGIDQEADMIRTAHERALFEDLIDLHAKYIFNENDLIIINTLRHWALRAVVRFAETFASRSSPYFHIINLFSSQPVKGELGPNVRHYREAFAAILQSHRRDRINLYADSDTLISEYQELGAVNIQLAPFPQYFALPRDYDATKELKVAYIGEAREHKGFHMLPFVSQRLQRAKVPARLLIQSFTSDPSQPFYQRSITFLSRAPNVELFSEALSRSQFSDLLELSDIFLLPYGLETYHTQTSAVFAAAMSLGTPVVATRGTWMGRKVTKYGVGALCNPADYLSVANALDVVIKDYPKFKEASIEASASWRRFNSAENFLRLVGAV